MGGRRLSGGDGSVLWLLHMEGTGRVVRERLDTGLGLVHSVRVRFRVRRWAARPA